jgi:hypothetical protein
MSADQTAVMEYRLSSLEASVGEIRQAVKSIDASLQVLARLEQRHAETRDGLERAFGEIADHEARVRVIEQEQPTTKLIKGWVIAGVVGGLSMMGIAMAKLVMA